MVSVPWMQNSSPLRALASDWLTGPSQDWGLKQEELKGKLHERENRSSGSVTLNLATPCTARDPQSVGENLRQLQALLSLHQPGVLSPSSPSDISACLAQVEFVWRPLRKLPNGCFLAQLGFIS